MNAYSLQNKQILVVLPVTESRLERQEPGGAWLVLAASGFAPDDDDATPIPVAGNFLDTLSHDGIYQYRARNFAEDASAWKYTLWVKCGSVERVGYTFGNYKAPEGSWGEIITVDDLRYTYLWGVDFRASNGDTFADAQIQFFIDAILQEVEKRLNITIRKTRVVCDPDRRGLVKGKDYDAPEDYYTVQRSMPQTGAFHTRKRPVISVSRCDLVNRNNSITSLLPSCRLEHTKGRISFMNLRYRQDHISRGIEVAISPYGAGMMERNMYYAVDYTAGFETCDDVPMDLRQIIAKIAACSLLNIIGRGLMSGFSSSSLSMDGVSESFSSTQSATSAYYGADIKEYKNDIDNYISALKKKYGHIALGVL